ncbi:hypothetical protein Bbelb_407660 [Branchiostoma belcheri]|nr:hypothetical protein Bbelb_407660 [Branchiostoma belcheri]
MRPCLGLPEYVLSCNLQPGACWPWSREADLCRPSKQCGVQAKVLNVGGSIRAVTPVHGWKHKPFRAGDNTGLISPKYGQRAEFSLAPDGHNNIISCSPGSLTTVIKCKLLQLPAQLIPSPRQPVCDIQTGQKPTEIAEEPRLKPWKRLEVSRSGSQRAYIRSETQTKKSGWCAEAKCSGARQHAAQMGRFRV